MMKKAILVQDKRHVVDEGAIAVERRILFQFIKELIRFTDMHVEATYIESLLEEVRYSALHHFKNEERLIGQSGMPTEQWQKLLAFHQNFINYLDRINVITGKNSNIPVGSLFVFIEKWLHYHFNLFDTLVVHRVPAGTIENEVDDSYKELGKRTLDLLEQKIRLDQEIIYREKAEADKTLFESRLRAMVDYVHNWEYWQDANGHTVYISPSCERITGYTEAQFVENRDLIYEIIHPDDQKLMEQHRSDPRFHEEGEDEIPYRIIRRNGTVSWIKHACRAVYSSTGEFLGRRGSNRDYNLQYRQENSLRLAETVFNAVNDAVIVADHNGYILAVNSSFAKTTGYVFDEVAGKDSMMLFNEEYEQRKTHDVWREVYLNGYWEGYVHGRHKENHTYEAKLTIYCVHNKEGRLTNYIAIFSDIGEQKKNEEHIYKLAHFDMLTGLPNRALFTEHLQQELKIAKRTRKILALMFVDLDKFKSVNDTLGHHVGDLLLKEVAHRLKQTIRESDMAARIGGDEFIVLLPIVHSEKDAIRIGENILSALEKPYILKGKELNIGASIGIAMYPEHGSNHEDLLSKSDAAMYEAKHGDGPSVISYSVMK